MSKVHWSQKCLDGRPLFCDGLSIVFRLAGADTPIQLLVKNELAPAPANVKRAPYDQENYLSSTWVQSLETPAYVGLRCLRVLAPHTDMTVVNVTEASTGGKALEGTVNRILLRLTAGSAEECRKISVKSSMQSFLVSATGESTKISNEASDDPDKESYVDPTNPKARTPMLVREDSSATPQMMTFGYATPNGWAPLSGSHQDGDTSDSVVLKEMLNPGESVYAFVDIFRPSPDVTSTTGSMQPGEDLENMIYDHSTCRSEIEISIQYEQKRLVPGPRNTEKVDTVVLSETISIVWNPPLLVKFLPSTKTGYPSGNRHPSNGTVGLTVGPDSELVLIDGERVTARCTLEAAAAEHGLLVDLDRVSFLVSRLPSLTFDFRYLNLTCDIIPGQSR